MKITASQLATLVDKPFAPSEWFRIDQQRIDVFADATLDHQFIHVDPARAAKTPFGATVAHGYLMLSLLPHLTSQPDFSIEGELMTVNYGLNKVRFVNPVKVNSEVRAVRTIRAAEERQPGQWLITTEVTVEIKGASKPALVAETLGLIVVAAATG
jgi:acyl dehydratase